LAVGEAERREAGGGVGLVAEGVAGLGGDGAVVSEAVGLDHEPEVGPIEVDLEAIEWVLGQRWRQAGGGGEASEARLELGVGEAEGQPVKQLAKRPDAGLAGALLQGGPQRLGVNQVELVRLVHSALEAVGGKLSAEVDEGLDGHGDGNTPMRSDRRGRQGRAPTTSDASLIHIAPGPDRYIDLPAFLPTDFPKRGRAAMTQHGFRSTDEQRHHPVAFATEIPPAHCINAPPNGMQATDLDPMPDGARSEAERQQLGPRHHPMLLPDGFPDGSIVRCRVCGRYSD
jgi:hypothetical protein